MERLLGKPVEDRLRLREPPLLDVCLRELHKGTAVLLATQLLDVELVQEDEVGEQPDRPVQLVGLETKRCSVEHDPQLPRICAPALGLQVLVSHLGEEKEEEKM